MWINGLYVVDYPSIIKTEKITEERQELLQKFSEMLKEIKQNL